MNKYKGKAKCSCGARAKWKYYIDGRPMFVCNKPKCKERAKDCDDIDIGKEEHFSEADYQTWMKLK